MNNPAELLDATWQQIQKMADHALITEAICRAVREAVLKHARDGHPVATWENGQVVWIPPDEILSRLGNGPTG